MMDDTKNPLAFDPPESRDSQAWAYAVGESVKFTERYLIKCRELLAAREEGEQCQGRLKFVIRNLIGIADNCEEVIAATESAADAETDSTIAEDEETGQQREQRIMAALPQSVHRSVVDVLEHLGVHRVDLMARTYGDVEYEGMAVEDPFEVLEATQEGPARSLPVLGVIRALWVRVDKGRVSVVRQGKVTC